MLTSTTTLARGTTVYFTTTFYDVNNAVVQPVSASINIVFPITGGGTDSTDIDMTAPSAPAVAWTAEWDSRVASAGTVSWSIQSSGAPYAVEDGQFVLTANPANISSI